MLTRHDLTAALRGLGIPPDRPVIAHASLSAFGEVERGAEGLIDAILSCCKGLVMPAFTYKTMLVPEDGPPGNGLLYGSGVYTNRMADPFHAGMPADRLMGAVPETLRNLPGAMRSTHPILSFTGIRLEAALRSQTLAEPLAPIRVLAEQDGWVLLLGVNHTVNTSIHYGEKLAGRKQFLRWALGQGRILACPGFPGCSDGFQAIEPMAAGYTRQALIGKATVRAMPLRLLLETVRGCVHADPLALLCARSYCERCTAVRESINGSLFR